MSSFIPRPESSTLTTPGRFDAQRAYDHTRDLCYPRRVGTPGERRAARYISRRFASLGLNATRERFVLSQFPAEIGSRIVFAVCAALVLAGTLIVGASPLAAALAWGLAALLFNAPWRVSHFIGERWPPRTSSENVLATLPESSPAAPARVVFLAHYDSKSQWLPTGVRVALVTAGAGLSAILALLGLAAAIGFPHLLQAIGAWPLAISIFALVVGLLLNFSGNRSPGALDNGSAVGVLLELARSWRPRADAPLEVVWVATGSEEVELDGARHLLRTHADWWEEKPTLLINLESVGAGSHLYLAGEPQALGLARAVADDMALPHASLRVLGAGMDHEPFAVRGLPAVSLLGDVVRTSFALHSSRDDMRLIERSALDRAGRLASELAWHWAHLHQPAPAAESETDVVVAVERATDAVTADIG